MRPRRVLFDLLAASTGGQLTRAEAFLQRFRRYDPDAELWILQERQSLGALVERPDIHVVNIEPPPGPRALWRMAWQNLRLPALARRHAFDVYLSFSHYLPWTLPRDIATVIGVANLAPFSADALHAEGSRRGRLRLIALKKTILSSAARAQHVIALSHTCRDVLIAHGIAADKVCVISNGVAPPAVAPQGRALEALRARWPIPERFILYVSHFYPYKNFERLVEAFASLAPELRHAHPLVLVGAPHDRHYFDTVRAAIARMGVQRDVIIVPGLEAASLSALYRAATLFVYPSLVENSPNILLEAMAHGAPVLAGAHQPMPEFGGDAVCYVDVRSVPAMAEAIGAMLSAPEELTRLRELGPLRAARYTWDAFTREVVALYRQASETTGSPAKARA